MINIDDDGHYRHNIKIDPEWHFRKGGWGLIEVQRPCMDSDYSPTKFVSGNVRCGGFSVGTPEEAIEFAEALTKAAEICAHLNEAFDVAEYLRKYREDIERWEAKQKQQAEAATE